MQDKVPWRPSGRQGGLFSLGSVRGRVEGVFESQGLLPSSLVCLREVGLVLALYSCSQRAPQEIMIIKALSFVPVLTQPGHARRDGVGAEKEEEKKKQEVKWGEEMIEKTATLERPP